MAPQLQQSSIAVEVRSVAVSLDCVLNGSIGKEEVASEDVNLGVVWLQGDVGLKVSECLCGVAIEELAFGALVVCFPESFF